MCDCCFINSVGLCPTTPPPRTCHSLPMANEVTFLCFRGGGGSGCWQYQGSPFLGGSPNTALKYGLERLVETPGPFERGCVQGLPDPLILACLPGVSVCPFFRGEGHA